MALDSLRGHLLIASPSLVDPSFDRAVVLVTEHSVGGAMGVILNRPSQTSVAEISDELAALVVDPDAVIFEGGPVEPEALIVLAEFEDPSAAAVLVVGDVGLVSVEADSESLPDAVRDARVFAGYAGWAPGQLDAELEADAWIVESPSPDELLGEDVEGLWQRVLERKGGRYLLLSRMPPDPSLN